MFHSRSKWQRNCAKRTIVFGNTPRFMLSMNWIYCTNSCNFPDSFSFFTSVPPPTNFPPINTRGTWINGKGNNINEKSPPNAYQLCVCVWERFHTVVAPVSSPKAAWISAASARESNSMLVKAALILLNCYWSKTTERKKNTKSSLKSIIVLNLTRDYDDFFTSLAIRQYGQCVLEKITTLSLAMASVTNFMAISVDLPELRKAPMITQWILEYADFENKEHTKQMIFTNKQNIIVCCDTKTKTEWFKSNQFYYLLQKMEGGNRQNTREKNLVNWRLPDFYFMFTSCKNLHWQLSIYEWSDCHSRYTLA